MKKKVGKLIEVLENQISQLENEDFDLESWKSGVITRLQSIYPKDDYRIVQLKEIKIEYSSWTLRDSNASFKPLDTCKKTGKTILEAIIDDLKVFGLPGDSVNKNDSLAEVLPESSREKFISHAQKYKDPAFKILLQSFSKKELADIIVALMKN